MRLAVLHDADVYVPRSLRPDTQGDRRSSPQKHRTDRPVRWLTQQNGVVTLSRITSEARLAENLRVFDFELSQEEMVVIHALAQEAASSIRPVWLRSGIPHHEVRSAAG